MGENPTNNIGARNIDKNGDYEAHIETQNYDCVNHQNHKTTRVKVVNPLTRREQGLESAGSSATHHQEVC